MPGRHKLTLRIDEDLHKSLQQFAGANGISIGSLIEVALSAISERGMGQADRPVEAWLPRDALTEHYVNMVGAARLLDSARRRRS